MLMHKTTIVRLPFFTRVRGGPALVVKPFLAWQSWVVIGFLGRTVSITSSSKSSHALQHTHKEKHYMCRALVLTAIGSGFQYMVQQQKEFVFVSLEQILVIGAEKQNKGLCPRSVHPNCK